MLSRSFHRILSLYILVLAPFYVKSQFSKDDTRIKYLERKLTYNYYNTSDGMWWVNTFKYYPEFDMCKFKSVSAENPGQILGKKYTERIFSFSDLNPYLITISSIEDNQGYLVKGDLIRIEAVKHQKLIKKNINTVSATPQSYIHFVIPEYLKDSSQSITDTLVMHFESLILESTGLKRSASYDQDAQVILDALTGEFEIGNVKRFAEKKETNIITYEDYEKRVKIKSGVFRYDPSENLYYNTVYENGELLEEVVFSVDESTDTLVLKGVHSEETKIIFENKSKIIYKVGALEIEYRPSRSF